MTTEYGMTLLQLPKVELKVGIAFRSGSESLHWGTVFLESSSPFHDGPETVENFLNRRKEQFFPFFDHQNNKFFQVNRKAIFFLYEPIVETERMIGAPAMVFLSDGGAHDVFQITDLPSDHSRLQDYMNLDREFLVFSKTEALLYFNRSHILKVTEHE